MLPSNNFLSIRRKHHDMWENNYFNKDVEGTLYYSTVGFIYVRCDHFDDVTKHCGDGIANKRLEVYKYVIENVIDDSRFCEIRLGIAFDRGHRDAFIILVIGCTENEIIDLANHIKNELIRSEKWKELDGSRDNENDYPRTFTQGVAFDDFEKTSLHAIERSAKDQADFAGKNRQTNCIYYKSNRV